MLLEDKDVLIWDFPRRVFDRLLQWNSVEHFNLFSIHEFSLSESNWQGQEWNSHYIRLKHKKLPSMLWSSQLDCDLHKYNLVEQTKRLHLHLKALYYALVLRSIALLGWSSIFTWRRCWKYRIPQNQHTYNVNRHSVK